MFKAAFANNCTIDIDWLETSSGYPDGERQEMLSIKCRPEKVKSFNKLIATVTDDKNLSPIRTATDEHNAEADANSAPRAVEAVYDGYVFHSFRIYTETGHDEAGEEVSEQFIEMMFKKKTPAEIQLEKALKVLTEAGLDTSNI